MAGNPPDNRSEANRSPGEHWTRRINGSALPGQRYNGVVVRGTLMEHRNGAVYPVGDPGQHVLASYEASGSWKHDEHPDPATSILASHSSGSQPGFGPGQYLVPHSMILHNLDQNNPENSTQHVVNLWHGDEGRQAQERHWRQQQRRPR